MEENEYNRLSKLLHDLTPAMIDDLHLSITNEPSIVRRYKPEEMRTFAEEGVVNFRDLLLGALKVNLPSIVNKQLDWLDKMLKARNIETDRVHIFLDLLRNRLNKDTKPEENAPLMQLLDQIESQVGMSK
jgi:hypothetical protein